jgi:asparagine synthase (glutamine-hydrolysing)
MCGICGLLAFDGAPADRVSEAMTRVLGHRGPDSEGVHVDGALALGATRLAILDIERADQPMTSADGQVTIVHNGEIYNHAQLRSELQSSGSRFRTSGDTEVLLELYRRHGPGFPGRLRGMFATAIWDAPHRRLVLARDAFGIKPLFYRLTRDCIAFASELKSLLLLPGFSREIDREALACYLAQNSIAAPLTIFEQARKLAPGHVLVCEDGDVTITRFARPGPVAADQLRREPARELVRELREVLRDSVRAHLVSDVPVGVLLSGGIDSCVLTALAAQEGPAPPATFSIGFQEQSFNELERARAVAARWHTDHHELVLRPDAAELLVEMAGAFDEPFGDSSALPTYLVSRLASEHVKVVLSGEGGDELFGGYETYAADLLAQRLPGAVALLAPLVERLPSSNGRVSVEYRAKRFLGAMALEPLERHQAFKQIFSAQARSQLLLDADAAGDFDVLAAQRRRFSETAGAPLLARLQDVDLGVYLVDDLLVKTDRMSMAHSLEARVPFLDRAVCDFALSLPSSLRVRGLQKKRLLRAAAAAWLPRRIVHGRKRGFSIPAAAWLRGELLPLAREVLSDETLTRQGVFRPAAVQALLDEHVARRRDNSRQLWGLMMFTLWRETLTASPQASVSG